MRRLGLALTLLTAVLAAWAQTGRPLEAGPFFIVAGGAACVALLCSGLPWLSAACRVVIYVLVAERFTLGIALSGAYVLAMAYSDRRYRWPIVFLFLPFLYRFSAPGLLAAGWVAWSLQLLRERRFTQAQGGLQAALCLIDALWLIDLGRPALAIGAAGVFCVAVIVPSLCAAEELGPALPPLPPPPPLPPRENAILN